MSRCFPYPPPGYARNGIGDEALIESIKMIGRKTFGDQDSLIQVNIKGEKWERIEAEKAKKERKKEKRQEKKERKEKENGEVDKKKHRHKRRHEDDGNLADEKGQYGKKGKLDSKLAERSNLTEEHGKPINSQNSSDSTLNSNQRPKPGLLPEAGQSSASFIRIRLPLQRHRDPEVVPNGEQFCPAPVRTDIFAFEKHVHALRSNSVSRELLSASSAHSGQELAIKHGRTVLHLSTGANETSTSGNELLTMPKLEQHRSSSSEIRYINLIENWAPPEYLTMSVDLNDQNWLFEVKSKSHHDTDRCKVKHDCLVNTSSTAWPVSPLLLELGIYALPYTVPH